MNQMNSWLLNQNKLHIVIRGIVVAIEHCLPHGTSVLVKPHQIVPRNRVKSSFYYL